MRSVYTEHTQYIKKTIKINFMEPLFFYKGDQVYQSSDVFTFINLILKHQISEVFVSSKINKSEFKKLDLLQSLNLKVYTDIKPLPKGFIQLNEINIQRSQANSKTNPKKIIFDSFKNLSPYTTQFLEQYLNILNQIFDKKLFFSINPPKKTQALLFTFKYNKKIIFIYQKNTTPPSEKTLTQVKSYLSWAQNFENKQTELGLQKFNNQLIEESFNHLPHPVVIINSQYEVIHSNLKANQYFNNSKKTGPCYTQFFNRQHPCPGCHLGRSFQTNSPSRKKFYSVLYQEFPDLKPQMSSKKNQENLLHVLTYVDITKAKQEEDLLLENSKAIDLGLLSSGVAHEIKNPLSGLLLHLELLLMDPQISDKKKKLIIDIQKETLKITAVIENILKFTKGDEPHSALSFSIEKDRFV